MFCPCHPCRPVGRGRRLSLDRSLSATSMVPRKWVKGSVRHEECVGWWWWWWWWVWAGLWLWVASFSLRGKNRDGCFFRSVFFQVDCENSEFPWGFRFFQRHLQWLVFQDFGSKQKFDPSDPKLGDKWLGMVKGTCPLGTHQSPKLWHKELPGGVFLFFLGWLVLKRDHLRISNPRYVNHFLKLVPMSSCNLARGLQGGFLSDLFGCLRSSLPEFLEVCFHLR